MDTTTPEKCHLKLVENCSHLWLFSSSEFIRSSPRCLWHSLGSGRRGHWNNRV